MNQILSIIIPARRNEYELDAIILSLKKRLAFLELPVCKETMTEATRLAEVKGVTATFKALLIERQRIRDEDALYS